MTKFKVKERILKAAREKKLVTYRGVPMRLPAHFSKETLQARGIGKKYSNPCKAGNYSKDCATQKSYRLESKGR